jgi:hypothetical protein
VFVLVIKENTKKVKIMTNKILIGNLEFETAMINKKVK